MNDSNNDKARGLTHLKTSDWPSLPTWIIVDRQSLNELKALCERYPAGKRWILRSLKPIPIRYEVGNKSINNASLREHLRDNPQPIEARIPFCLQPFVDSIAAGIFLIKGKQILAEFTLGSSSQFLRGVDEPYKRLYEKAKVE
ncbi:MAG: hypothetical protein AAFZ17_08380 [Cyanobacteria bacterium J06650_10]